jgi:uncharacterized protein (DUF2141 family)
MKLFERTILFVALTIATSILLIKCKSNVIDEKVSPDIITDAVAVDSAAMDVPVTAGEDPVVPVGSATTAVKACKPLMLTIRNLASSTAPVIVGIYKSKNRFLYKESRLKEYKVIPKGKTLSVCIRDVCYGEYAIAVYQDENSNGEFDKNFIGMPKERYAFSNNFRPKVKAPTYSDCKFNYDSTSSLVIMDLVKF